MSLNFKRDDVLNVACLIVLGGVVAHRMGWLPAAWSASLSAPAQIQKNLAALRPAAPSPNVPDPTAAPLVDLTTSSSDPQPQPPQPIAPAVLPEAAKKECQGSVGQSITPFSFDQFAKVTVLLGNENAVIPGTTLAQITETIGAPVCQLPTINLKAGYPLERHRFVGSFQGKLFQLVIAFQNGQASHFRISPLQ